MSGRGSRATVERADVCGNGTKGVGVQSGGLGVVRWTRVTGNREGGVFASDEGTLATVADSFVCDNGLRGVGVQARARARTHTHTHTPTASAASAFRRAPRTCAPSGGTRLLV